MPTLFNGENSDSDGELKINKDYAGSYNNWRQKEELNKLKTKYGDVGNLSGSSDTGSDSESLSEDEEDEKEVAERFDKEFYKTLACLKKKDPKIYDKGVQFFNETNQAQELRETTKQQKSGDKSKKEKAVFLRDYERKIIVEKEGKLSDDEEESLSNKKQIGKNMTYVEEQRKLKDSFKHILLDEDQNDDEPDLLKPKSKSKNEIQKEDADYKEWLKGQQTEIDVTQKEELKPLRDFWNNPNLDANEKFLRDYVLNNKYLDTNHSGADLDYEHVIHDSDENLSEDEKNIEKQEEFEHKYNFRFEEPDKEFIKRYPRTMENSLRKKDTRRAQKRAEVKQRKEEEKLKKKEELMQLKALKRKEIEEKIEKLKEITGNDDVKFNDIDLEGDFDPNEHDRKMTEIFNEDYYAAVEDENKPEFPDIDEELEIEHTWDNYDPDIGDSLLNDHGPHCEDADFNMDADYDGSQTEQSQNIVGTKRRKGRRRTKFAELLQKEKPKYDPQQYKSYEEYFDKYYSLDYEDMIGDLPCRFKYRKVVPNDYGLSVEEILMADDKELNKWCSLKKALQYKPEHVELNDVRMYKQKAANDALKKKILRSLYTEPEEEQDGVTSPMNSENAESKKRRRKKKKHHTNDTGVPVNEDANKSSAINGKCDQSKEIKTNTDVPMKNTKASKGNKRVQESKDSDQPERKKLKVDQSSDGSKDLIEKQARKEKKKESGTSDTKVSNSELQVADSSKNSKKKMKSKKKLENMRKNNQNLKNRDANGDITSLNSERLKTYGINPKKLKNKLKYGNKQY